MNEPLRPEDVPKVLLQQRIEGMETSNANDLRDIRGMEASITEMQAGIARRNEVIAAMRAALAKLEG